MKSNLFTRTSVTDDPAVFHTTIKKIYKEKEINFLAHFPSSNNNNNN